MAGKKRTGKRPPSNGDEQVEILRAIWNEMKSLNGRVGETNERLDQTNERLDNLTARVDRLSDRVDDTNQRLDTLSHLLNERIDALGRRVVESEIRLATVTSQLSGDVQELTSLIRDWRAEHRADRDELKSRVARIEAHLGLSH